MNAKKEILLSHIVPARNDNYLGNFKQRLEMMINYNCKNVVASGNQDNYELIICDWNSETPLRHDLYLSDEARELIKFVEVPTSVLKKHNLITDYPIRMDIAQNVGYRRANGLMTMMTPADVLIPQNSMANLFQVLKGELEVPVDIYNCYLGIERFLIPWQVSSRMTLDNIDNNLLLYSNAMKRGARYHGLSGGEGALVISKKILMDIHGIDETLPYWGAHELQLSLRINHFAPSLKLSKYGVFAYDLQQAPALRAKEIKVNDMYSVNNPVVNDENWGLNNIDEIVITKAEKSIDKPHSATIQENAFAHLMQPKEQAAAPLIGFKNIAKHVLEKLKVLYQDVRTTMLCDKYRIHGMEIIYNIATSLPNNAHGGNSDFISATLDKETSFGILKNLINNSQTSDQTFIQHCDYGLFINLLLGYTALSPSRLLNLNSKNIKAIKLLTTLDPTMIITSYHEGQDDIHYEGCAIGATIKEYYQGFVHQVFGPRKTALSRIRNTELINAPYDIVFLDLNYWNDMTEQTVQELAPLLAENCALICNADDTKTEYLRNVQKLFKEINFNLEAQIGTCCTLIKNK